MLIAIHHARHPVQKSGYVTEQKNHGRVYRFTLLRGNHVFPFNLDYAKHNEVSHQPYCRTLPLQHRRQTTDT